MKSVGRQSDKNVSGSNIFTGNDLALIRHADNEAGKIVLASGIEAGHLRGFAADECAAVMPAGFSDAFHNLLRNLRLKRSGGQIVHEEQRRGALHGNVIHAVIHQIATHGVMDVHHESQLQLGAHAIHAGDHHGLAKFLLVHGEHAAKSADFTDHALGEGAVSKILDPLFGAVGPIDVNTAVCVGNWLFQNTSV